MAILTMLGLIETVIPVYLEMYSDVNLRHSVL